MKVELAGSPRKALLKRWLGMGEGKGSIEGGEDEASQQHRLSMQQFATAKECHRNLSMFNHL